MEKQMDRLMQLRQALGRAVDILNSDAVIDDAAKYAETEAEIAALEGQIQRLEAAQARAASLARPVNGQGVDANGAVEEIPTSQRTLSSLVYEARSFSQR